MSKEFTCCWRKKAIGPFPNCGNEMKCRRRKRNLCNLCQIWFISYIIYNTHFFYGNIWTHNWPAPNVSGFIAQLVEHRTGNREFTGSNPVEVLNFFQASLRICTNCVHCDDYFFISFPQFMYDLFHISLALRTFYLKEIVLSLFYPLNTLNSTWHYVTLSHQP